MKPHVDWISSPADPRLRRGTQFRPGWDKPGDRHPDEWVYVVGDGITALSIVVGSGRVGGWRLPNCGARRYNVEAYSMHYHRPTGKPGDDAENTPCEFIEAGRCFGLAWYAWASEWFAQFGESLSGTASERAWLAPYIGTPPMPSEAFWLGLERAWKEVRSA